MDGSPLSSSPSSAAPAPPPPVPAGRPPALTLPRPLIFLASLWLLGSWALAMGLRTPVHPTSASFTPGVRMMLMCVTIGLMIAWPLMRLSQAPTPYPGRQTLLDLVVLLALVQIVLWPLRLVTVWSPLRTAAIDMALFGWVLLAGAVVASVIGSPARGPRALAMLACIALTLLGPALAWLGIMAGADWMQVVRLSPLMAIETLGRGGGVPPSRYEWNLLLLLLATAALTWLALGLVLMRQPAPAAVSRRDAPVGPDENGGRGAAGPPEHRS